MKNKIFLTILILSVISLVFSSCGGGGSVTPSIPDNDEGETVIEYAESTTDQEGIGNFNLIGGKLSVEVFDAQTDEAIKNIECYLSTDGTDAVLLLVDPAGEYVPRLTSWQDEYSTKGYIWGKIRHSYLHLKSQFLEGGSHLVYIDEYLPEGLTKEVLNEQYNWYYTTELKNLRRDLRGLVNALIDIGIGYVETKITTYALSATVIGAPIGGFYSVVSDCYTLNQIIELGVINDLANEYEKSGYEGDQKFEIWEAKWLSADFGSVLILPTDIPKSSTHPIAYIDSINPNPALQGENVSFAGHGTDPDGEVWFYRWKSNIDGLLSTSKSFNKSDLSVGTHTISFKVLDAGVNPSDAVSESLTITLDPYQVGGQISGSVKDAVIQSPLQSVSVKAYDGNSLISSGTTGPNGVYSVPVPAGSGYRVEFTKSGYIPAIYYGVSVVANVTTYLETVLQIDINYSGKGNISGRIFNALTGEGVSGLTIKLREGINVTSGTVITSTTTENGGYYSVTNLNAGYYTAEVSGTGYNTTYFTVICIGGTTTDNQNATITPILSSSETRIVLTWGETPEDIDSHLTGPLPDGTRFHMYWWHAELCESGCSGDGSSWPEYVKLDKDDTSSYGPETTTIYQQISGVYRFSVHDYTNRDRSYSTALSNSGAQVRVYRGNNLITNFNVPADQEGTLWTVFEMDGDTIIPINTMSYESDSSVVRQSSAPDAELMKNLPPKR